MHEHDALLLSRNYGEGMVPEKVQTEAERMSKLWSRINGAGTPMPPAMTAMAMILGDPTGYDEPRRAPQEKKEKEKTWVEDSRKARAVAVPA